MLEQWIRAPHLDPTRAAADAAVRPYSRYTIIDHFLTDDGLRVAERAFAAGGFEPDNEGSNYDSSGRIIADASPLGALFSDASWFAFVHAALGIANISPTARVATLRLHKARSFGFWPHSDDLPSNPKRVAILIYFNRNWRVGDGGVLQMWEARDMSDEADVLRYDDWLGRPLSFLETRTDLALELGGHAMRPVTRLRLIDVVAPIYNRALFIDIRSTPVIHSVSPGRQPRKAILQWLV